MLTGWARLAALILIAGCSGCTATPQPGQETGATSAPILSSSVLAEPFNSRGVAYFNQGQLDSAIADFDQAIRLAPNSAIAYSNRGAAYVRKGQLDRAIPDLDQAVRLAPNLAIALSNRGTVYALKGNYHLD